MTTTNTTTTYDQYEFIISYITPNGRLEIEETQIRRKVKKGSRIGTEYDLVEEELRNLCEEDEEYYGGGFDFASIYKGCKRVRTQRIVKEIA